MSYDRHELVRLLRNLGYQQAADEAAQVLPEQISNEQIRAFGDQHGISRDELVNRMGGSP
jgi:hypothetical protein